MRRAVGGGYGLGEPSRGGQITPSHPGPPRSRGLFLHLKSGARGFRLPRRSSHIAPPQIGQRGMPLASTPPRAAPALAVAAGAADAGCWRCEPPVTEGVGPVGKAPVVPRGGQITPPHAGSLHLKSGAFGFRFPSRLSHIGPWHLGHVGTESASGVLGWVIAAAAEGTDKTSRVRFRGTLMDGARRVNVRNRPACCLCFTTIRATRPL